jgi:uncharacterized protein (DUF302 family)
VAYYFSKTVSGDFDGVVDRTIAALKEEGFGVLTDIDVKATLKKKLGVDFRKYRILGSCNPPFAYQALQAEDKIGILLPCNVIVQELEEGVQEVAVVNPLEAMASVKNEALAPIAVRVEEKMRAVLDHL